jgi:hypothetical protein
MTRRLRRCSILLLTLPLLGAALAAPAQAAPPAPVAVAAGWLSTQFVDGSHLPAPDGDHFDSKFGSSYFPNYGENADVLFALAAAKAGGDKARDALDFLDAHLADYADPAGAFGGPFDGSIAKTALAHLVAGTSADSLLTTLKSDECAAKAKKCTPGAPANIFASASDSFVILAEARAGGSFAPSADATDYFLSLQCSNGGFTTGTAACGSGDADIDATSYGLMALQALGGHASAVTAAADWLDAQRKPAGYWIVQGIPNTNSTGLATAALAGAGRDVSTSRSWLLDQRIPAGQPGAGALEYDGKFTPTTTSATSLNVLATAQGILALVDGGSLATVSAAGSSAGVTLAAPTISLSRTSVAPGGSLTVHAVGFAAGEQVQAFLAADPKHAVGAATVDASGVATLAVTVPSTITTGSVALLLVGRSSDVRSTSTLTISAPVVPPAGPPPLANTGAASAQLVSLGLGLLVAGAFLTGIGRRRSRHAA